MAYYLFLGLCSTKSYRAWLEYVIKYCKGDLPKGNLHLVGEIYLGSLYVYLNIEYQTDPRDA